MPCMKYLPIPIHILNKSNDALHILKINKNNKLADFNDIYINIEISE